MNCNFNTALTQSYHSQSQIIRILTESWVSEYMYCPHCGNASLNHFPNNKAVADFYCPNCNNEYELKSKAGSISLCLTSSNKENLYPIMLSARVGLAVIFLSIKFPVKPKSISFITVYLSPKSWFRRKYNRHPYYIRTT